MNAQQLSVFDVLAMVAEPAEPTPEVIRVGAKATAVPTHRHVPPLPAGVHDPEAWLALLAFAEDARRFNDAPRAVPALDRRGGAGTNGPICGSSAGGWSIFSNASGIRVRPFGAGPCPDQCATWPQALAGLRDQRDREPEVARARDLATAYSHLRYYGGVYGWLPRSEGWSPVPLITGIATEILQLGGDPTAIEPATDYMAAGVAAACEGNR